MRAYAEAFGDPNREASTRMEKRLEAMIAEEEAGGGGRRMWLVWAVLAALIGGTGLAAGVFLGNTGDDGVVAASSNAQRLRLVAGSAVLKPGAEVRVLHDDGRTVLELRAGVLELDADRSGASMQVLSGPYTVEASDARLQVEHSEGVPVVTVTRGEAVVRGPDLPPAGVVVIPVVPPDAASR
jgi:ferric-dicitrate binding protein FerR (iron transport regulator)